MLRVLSIQHERVDRGRLSRATFREDHRACLAQGAVRLHLVETFLILCMELYLLGAQMTTRVKVEYNAGNGIQDRTPHVNSAPMPVADLSHLLCLAQRSVPASIAADPILPTREVTYSIPYAIVSQPVIFLRNFSSMFSLFPYQARIFKKRDGPAKKVSYRVKLDSRAFGELVRFSPGLETAMSSIHPVTLIGSLNYLFLFPLFGGTTTEF